MKNLQSQLLFLLLSFVILLSSCKEKPPVSISDEVLTPCFELALDTFMDPRLPVQFINCSQNVSEFEWDFGDGTTSKLADPSHLFSQTGVYDVKLTGKTGTITKAITKKVRVEFPYFKKVRLLETPVLNPSDGLPWEDSNGLSFVFALKYDGFPGTLAYGTPWNQNIELPYDIVFNSDVSIDQAGWEFYFFARQSNPDTLQDVFLLFDQLMDAPVKRVDRDSVVFEIYMRSKE